MSGPFQESELYGLIPVDPVEQKTSQEWDRTAEMQSITRGATTCERKGHPCGEKCKWNKIPKNRLPVELESEVPGYEEHK